MQRGKHASMGLLKEPVHCKSQCMHGQPESRTAPHGASHSSRHIQTKRQRCDKTVFRRRGARNMPRQFARAASKLFPQGQRRCISSTKNQPIVRMCCDLVPATQKRACTTAIRFLRSSERLWRWRCTMHATCGTASCAARLHTAGPSTPCPALPFTPPGPPAWRGGWPAPARPAGRSCH